MGEGTRRGVLGALLGFLVAASFGVGAIGMAAFKSSEIEDLEARLASGGPAAEEPQRLHVQLGDVFMEPTTLEGEPGPVSILVHNTGGTQHNFSIADLGVATSMLAPDTREWLDLGDVAAGSYTYRCDVPGHADAGMKGILVVGGGATGDAGGGMAGMTPEEMAQHDTERTAQFPAETQGAGGQLLEPLIASDGTKVYEVTAAATQWETEPGTFVEAYAYNGMVPGPEIRAELGDRVRIEFTNELPEPSTIHFHGMTVPADMDGVPVINQEAVMPGESFDYEFVVRNTGTNMYHSHFNAAAQVPMGLLGAFIVPDPKDPPSDQDVSMVLNDGPLGFTLNGKGFPATAPIVASRGEVVRVRYMNEGLQIHPMHLHGMPQEVIAIDGHLLEQPYTADTVVVAPGQRVDVLVRATQPGTWAFHCHILTHVEGPEGMFGMVTAFVVQ